MSLKDRFRTIQKQSSPRLIEEEANIKIQDDGIIIDSLGVLESLLLDDDLNNVFVYGARNIYVEKRGKISKSSLFFKDDTQLENCIKKIAKNRNITWDENAPFFEFNYKHGINLQATLPPLSSFPTLLIKCYRDKHSTILSLLEEHCVSKEIALILEALCTLDRNILITGDKGTFKTTLLSSLAKKIPQNNRITVIDSENEFRKDLFTYTIFDFLKAKNEKESEKLLDFILSTLPNKLVVNTNNASIIAKLIEKSENKKGFFATAEALTPQKAIDKLAQSLMDNNQHLTFVEAKSKVINFFDVIIHTQKDENGRRKIASVSEFNPISENELIQNIFDIDYSNKHKSTGVTPLFFKDIKQNSLPIGDNIFDINYRHTYYKTISLEKIDPTEKKNVKLDILKKFKKELPIPKEKIEHDVVLEENEPIVETQPNNMQPLEEFAIQIQDTDKNNNEN